MMQSFPIAGPGWSPHVTLWAVFVLVASLVTLIHFYPIWKSGITHGGLGVALKDARSRSITIGVGFFLVTCLVVTAYVELQIVRSHARLTEEQLVVDGVLDLEVNKEELTLDQARRVNLGREPEFQPIARTNAFGLGGYVSGWVRLRGGSRAFVALSGEEPLVLIPSQRDFVVLVSVEDPERFLEACANPAMTEHANEALLQ